MVKADKVRHLVHEYRYPAGHDWGVGPPRRPYFTISADEAVDVKEDMESGEYVIVLNKNLVLFFPQGMVSLTSAENICQDGTGWRTNEDGKMRLLSGCTDKAKGFHPTSQMWCDAETIANYRDLLEGLHKQVQICLGHDFNENVISMQRDHSSSAEGGAREFMVNHGINFVAPGTTYDRDDTKLAPGFAYDASEGHIRSLADIMDSPKLFCMNSECLIHVVRYLRSGKQAWMKKEGDGKQPCAISQEDRARMYIEIYHACTVLHDVDEFKACMDKFVAHWALAYPFQMQRFVLTSYYAGSAARCFNGIYNDQNPNELCNKTLAEQLMATASSFGQTLPLTLVQDMEYTCLAMSIFAIPKRMPSHGAEGGNALTLKRQTNTRRAHGASTTLKNELETISILDASTIPVFEFGHRCVNDSSITSLNALNVRVANARMAEDNAQSALDGAIEAAHLKTLESARANPQALVGVWEHVTRLMGELKKAQVVSQHLGDETIALRAQGRTVVQLPMIALPGQWLREDFLNGKIGHDGIVAKFNMWRQQKLLTGGGHVGLDQNEFMIRTNEFWILTKHAVVMSDRPFFTCTCPQYLQMACCKHSICMSMHKHKFGDGSYVPHADYLRLVGSRGQAKPGQKRKRNNSAQSTHPLNATYTTRGRYGVPTSPSNSNSAFGTVFLAPNAAATRPQRTRQCALTTTT